MARERVNKVSVEQTWAFSEIFKTHYFEIRFQSYLQNSLFQSNTIILKSISYGKMN